MDRRKFLKSMAATAASIELANRGESVFGMGRRSSDDNRPFIDRIGVAPVGGGFSMDGYWVWCGSVIKGADGKYHMFASRWSKEFPFSPNWMTNSEIVRAVSETPEGPYRFEEVIFKRRGRKFWDGMMTHNPTIHKVGETYLLYYIGTRYDFAVPTDKSPLEREKIVEANGNQRIGLATSKSVYGPWKRPDEPILEPRPGKWDSFITVNPAVCARDDGGVLLIYKSKLGLGDTLRLGAAYADNFEGPYRRLSDEPIFGSDTGEDKGIEDPYIWWNKDHYEAIMKDMTGEICGERHGGIHGWSVDGVKWNIYPNPKAYSRTVRWSDGSVTTQGHLERPQLLIEDGRPSHLFAATGDGPGGFKNMSRSWNMVIPLNGK